MELIFALTAIICTVYATVTDIRNRWVPDFINYFMIFFDVGGHIIYSITTANIWPAIASIAAA